MLRALLFSVLVTLAGAARNDSDSCTFSNTVTSASDVTKLNECSILYGEVTISGSGVSSVDLSQVREISGKVRVVNSSSVAEVKLGSLEKVSGVLKFEALTSLTSIQLSALTSAQTLLFVSVPALVTLDLGLGLANVSSLTLSDTALLSIDKLLRFQEIDILNVNNNKNIDLIDLSGLRQVTRGLTLSFNKDRASVLLSNLKWVTNLTLQDVGAVDISNLEAVNNTFVVAYTSLLSFYASSLSKAGALQVFANDNLQMFSMDNLTEIYGELFVANNTILQNIGLNKLETVEGALTIRGAIGNFSLPALDEVKGDFSIESTSDSFLCRPFNQLQNENKIKGHNYQCSSPRDGQTRLLSSSSSRPSSRSGSGSGSSQSRPPRSRNAGATNATPFMVLSCVVAAAVAFLV